MARLPSLQAHERLSIKNARGTITGEICVDFRLQSTEADGVTASLR